MRKHLCMILSIALMGILLVGCNASSEYNIFNRLTESSYVVNEFENATISNSSISGDTITLEISYTGETELILGTEFMIEVCKNGIWYTLPYKPNVGFTMVAYSVEPNDIKSMDYSWEWAVGTLSAGKYRIVIKVEEFEKGFVSDKYHEHYLAEEFTIE